MDCGIDGNNGGQGGHGRGWSGGRGREAYLVAEAVDAEYKVAGAKVVAVAVDEDDIM